MPDQPHIPTVNEIRRIVDLKDPVIRNLQITQSYHELAGVLAGRTGPAANWCTFATWASRQAGQTIRKEDLKRLLESRLQESPEAGRSLEQLAKAASREGGTGTGEHGAQLTGRPRLMLSVDRASDAVSRGNRKVFEEIGYEFARFYQTCIQDQEPDPEKISRFNEGLKPGEPPGGQGYLRQAFSHYYQAIFEPDIKTRAELVLLGNIEIGFHEQTRLQPEIAESMDAGLVSLSTFTRLLVTGLFPGSGLMILANLYLRRLLGRPTALDLAVGSLHNTARVQLRRVITEIMMNITLPSGEQVPLGQDLHVRFPDSLAEILNPDLRLLLERHDPTPDSLVDSGALDWADLPDRLHFIIDLFRCHQENRELFSPPFTAEQVEALRAGRLPGGRL